MNTLLLQEDTICAVSTPFGTGGIAVIRISGREAISIADKLFQGRQALAAAASHTVHYGSIVRNGTTLDNVLCTVFRTPHSFTGEDTVEIACHGSIYIQQELLRWLTDAGARTAQKGEFTKRAFLNGRLDLAQAVAPRMLTPRFSPGYGDFPLAQQAAFCSVLDVSRRIGVSLTSGSLMVPQKSVTALLGVSAHPPAARIAGCDACNLSDRCLYRKEGLSCGQ